MLQHTNGMVGNAGSLLSSVTYTPTVRNMNPAVSKQMPTAKSEARLLLLCLFLKYA